MKLNDRQHIVETMAQRIYGGVLIDIEERSRKQGAVIPSRQFTWATLDQDAKANYRALAAYALNAVEPFVAEWKGHTE